MRILYKNTFFSIERAFFNIYFKMVEDNLWRRRDRFMSGHHVPRQPSSNEPPTFIRAVWRVAILSEGLSCSPSFHKPLQSGCRTNRPQGLWLLLEGPPSTSPQTERMKIFKKYFKLKHTFWIFGFLKNVNFK